MALIDLGGFWISIAFIFGIGGAYGLTRTSKKDRIVGAIFGVLALVALGIHVFVDPAFLMDH